MNIISLESVFENTIFRIPDYQRGYSWTEKELNDLWTDLTNTHIGKNAFHFTGILTVSEFDNSDFKSIEKEGFTVVDNIILINNIEYKSYNLVDGQQRLTTILILLSRLVNKLKNEAEKLQYSRKYFFSNQDRKNLYLFGYHVDVPSRNFLIHDIFEDSSYEEEKTETLYTHNLLFAKKFFEGRVKDLSDNECVFLIKIITKRLLFSVLDLSVSKDVTLDISMIFETLNFRGKQLSGLERFKNRVLYLLSKQQFENDTIQKRRKLINSTWLEVYKWLGRNQKKQMIDDAFLKAFWLLYFSNDTMVAKDFKAYQYNLFENDFSLMNMSNNRFMKPDELQKWLKVMKRAVRLWYFINNPYEVDDDQEFDYIYTTKIQRSLARLNSFPFGYGSYMLNLVLAVLIKHLPKKNTDGFLSEEDEHNLLKVESILWCIERHNIMNFLFNGNKTNFNQEATFRDINKYFCFGKTVSEKPLKEVLEEYRVAQFEWENVRRNISQNQFFYSWDGIHFILKEYEELISGKKIDKDVSINLLYPDEENGLVRGLYPSFKKLHLPNKNRFTYSLGNLFISNNKHAPRTLGEHQARINNAVRNNYTIFESEKELLKYEEWTPEDIVKRGDKILNTILTQWNIAKPKNQGLYLSILGQN